MQNSENKTDRLFRDKLLNHEVVPPPGVWDNIAGSLDGNKRKRRMIFIWGVSLAASLLLAFIAGWYVAIKQPGEEVLHADIHQIKTEVPSQVLVAQSSTQKSIMKTNDSQIIQTNIKNELTDNRVSISEIRERENIFLKFLLPVESLMLPVKNNGTKLIAMNSEGFSELDRAIIDMNTGKKEELYKKEKHANWAVGVQASPVYRFQHSSATETNEFVQQYNTGSTDGLTTYVTNISGGIMVELNTSSRLSVQSGVNYGKVSQNPGEVGVSFAGQNWLNDRVDLDESKELTSVPNTTNNSSNNMTLKTQMGVANIAMPEGTALAVSNVANNFSPEVAKSYSIEQQAGYLEIPLVVRYKIIDSRFDFLILGGINTNVLMSNNVSLTDSKEIIANGKIEGLNPLTFSSSVGMGVNYAITDRFNLSIEPTMKIQLNSLNKLTSYNSRPYVIGIFTGISYQF